MDNFKPTFLANLKLALAVYRHAKVDIDERGLILHPSRPPVAPRAMSPGKVPTPAKVPAPGKVPTRPVQRTLI
jgi:hypothetical protein